MEENNRKQFQVTDDLLASHAQRFLNLLMDYIGQLFLFIIAFGIVGAIAQMNGNKEFLLNFAKNDIAQYTFAACVSLFYYNVFEIFSARTLGKLITQTIVVDENGEKPHHETILIRSLCRLIPFEVLSFIGMPARGWHDSISKTYVVNKTLLEEKKKQFYSLQ
jgi:uncharacterized RDD family membrane protein YckC